MGICHKQVVNNERMNAMKVTTVGDQFNELESKFKEALENEGFSEYEQKVLRDAIDSVQYVRGFFSEKHVLPKLEESVHTTWGKTFMWIRGSFINIEKAEAIVNSPKNENILQMVNGQCRSTDEKNVGHSLPGNRDIIGVDLVSGNTLDDAHTVLSTEENRMEDFGSYAAENEDDEDLNDEYSEELFMGLSM
ncbi:MAG: hypothetical protein J6J36_04285 [Clostridia bacterium]|nr:hypothetical protein [Clostridia bacterium]